MTDKEVKLAIQSAIKDFSKENLTDQAIHLFKTLGYNTERQNPFPQKNYKEFKYRYGECFEEKKFNEGKALVKEWKSVDLLFQLTKDEVSDQKSLFGSGKVKWEGEDKETVIETYLFFAIELIKIDYSRSALAQITREINKIFSMPVMLLFKYGEHLTLSVINRRLNKKDEQKDILEKVTLIKDISIQNPHRAHLEILFDLSFDQLKQLHKFTNFVELHNAWQKTLDTKELNKIFYQKLFNWYLWALKHVKFPQIRPKSDVIKENLYQSESLIRLITRLLFVWFMKEKRLVNSDLFDIEKLKTILKDFKGVNGETTIYYKAILQNLFFATLNNPIKERKVINKGFNPKEYGDPLVYRFDELFREPDNILEHFKDIPFLNGGLFECLDQKKDNENPIEIRLDGFSTTTYKQVIFPDKLFFGKYKNIDLSGDYNDNRKKYLTVFGIIDILNQYKFTIEENTAIEEEIALDPELLGKVFENLLASYIPETKTTARKQTGSFYTPREIVNYMVDESLVAYLKNHINDEARIRKLFSLSNENIINPFTKTETVTLLKAIDSCKVLDPACGSGAFPMGVLHKMIHILHKLDPENELWLEMVVNNVPKYLQSEFRARLKKENWNYVRKLGIIQQCIYGVDIQPIATQIAKLRFFISLLVDQTEKPNEPNRGIEPLPNLDFKIVTANSLISAPQSEEITTGLFENQSDLFFEKFNELTCQFFNTSKPEEKKELRRKITALIKNKTETSIKQTEINFRTALDSRFNKVIEEKNKKIIEKKEWEISLWQSYTNLFKHESVGFFEPRYFFPMAADGFNVVIGNPPYVQMQKDGGALADLYKNRGYKTFERTGDIYSLFYEQGIYMLKEKGNLCFITSNKWMRAGYGESTREFFCYYNPLKLIDLGGGVFESATVDTNILVIEKSKPKNNQYKLQALDISKEKDINSFEQFADKCVTLTNLSKDTWVILNLLQAQVKQKIERIGTPLKDWDINIYRGVLTGYNDAFIIDTDTKERLCSEDPKSAEIIKPLLRGRDIKRYQAEWAGLWLIATHNGYTDEQGNRVPPIDINKYKTVKDYLDQYYPQLVKRQDKGNNPYNLRSCAYQGEFEKEKVVYPETTQSANFYFDKNNLYIDKTAFMLLSKNINMKLLCTLLSSKLETYYYKCFLGGTVLGENGYQYNKHSLENLPIPKIPESEQAPFIALADKILETKKQNPNADTSDLEKQIDKLVYKLHELNDEEIAIIEGR